MSGARVDFVVLDPGAWMASDAVTTGPTGIAAVTGRVGLSLGAYTFTAESRDIHGAHLAGSPASVSVTAEAPAAGTIFTAVNVDHVSGTGFETGAGSTARVTGVQGIAVASDGTIYFTVLSTVYALDPDGELARIAGSSTAGGNGGDFGLAREATLNNPLGLALDEAAELLYVADTNNHRVRVIDLASGIISPFAGGGSAIGPGYGDDGPASDAALSRPAALAFGGGSLYVADDGHYRIRRVELASGIIRAFVNTSGASPGCAQTDPPIIIGGYRTTFALALDAQERLYVGASIACGGSGGIGNAPLQGILRRETNGTLVRIAGKSEGTQTDGAPAVEQSLDVVYGLVVAGDRVYLSTGHRVRVIDLVGGSMKTVAGTGAAAAATDYVPAVTSPLSTPRGLAVAPGGDLLMADSGHFSLRWIWAPVP